MCAQETELQKEISTKNTQILLPHPSFAVFQHPHFYSLSLSFEQFVPDSMAIYILNKWNILNHASNTKGKCE